MQADGLRDEAEADGAREVVAGQLAELIVETRMTGGRGLLVTRVRAVTAAERQGDPLALRAACMELAVAAAGWAVHLDLEGLADATRSLRAMNGRSG